MWGKKEIMNEIVKINYQPEEPTIPARDLHKALEITKRFSAWFETNSQGFMEGEDFTSVLKSTEVQNNGGIQIRDLQDYELSIDMAKHICLMSRTDKGRQCRQYLIDLEKAWNTPEQVMARALRLADKTINNLKSTIEKQKPLVDFANQVSDTTDLIDMKTMAKLLKDNNINIGRNRLFSLLRTHKILMADNQPYQKYIDAGYFKVNEYTYTSHNGHTKTNRQTFVTGKGQIYIAKKTREFLTV